MRRLVAILFAVLLLFANVSTTLACEPTVWGIPDEDYATIHQWDSYINKWADYYGMSPDLLRRVMWFESRGNPNAQSPQGAIGLMQVMSYHFDPDEDPWDVDTNVMNGAYLLWLNYKRYGSWLTAVKAYFGTVGADVFGTTAESYAAAIFDTKCTPQSPNAVFPIKNFVGQVQKHWGEAIGGTDIFAARGTPIRVISSGHVTFAGWDSMGGWSVLINGLDRLTYYYAHLAAQPAVWGGQKVTTGQLLGYVGNTGNATSTPPHLHLGIGYGIILGSGPLGGTGRDFNAITFLNSLTRK